MMSGMSQEELDKHFNVVEKLFGASDKICPFCDEKDFDLIGLKWHLMSGGCDKFNKTETPHKGR